MLNNISGNGEKDALVLLSAPKNRFTMLPMNRPKLDLAQLKRRDPQAWTTLLNSHEDMKDVVVTAVSSRPLQNLPLRSNQHQLYRYFLTLADHSDPICLIGKHTNRLEALFYSDFAQELAPLTPQCWLAEAGSEDGWLVLEDVPCHYPPEMRTAVDIEAMACDLAYLHLAFWERGEELEELPHWLGRHQKSYSWQELQRQEIIYFEEGPASIISDHAIKTSGRLAPVLLRAANGLAVIRALGGWPGILGESHLAAAADLLDDPLPMLERLNDLPHTMLHGEPHNYQWHLTLFEDRRLLDWHKVMVGPGIYDIVNFVEQLELVYRQENNLQLYAHLEMPISQETIIDSYILTLKAKLGSRFDARTTRQAIPAARCLYVLTHWFPHFADWFSDMPHKFTWQRVNRMSDTELMGTEFQPIVGFRPYLTAVFQRFLQSYRTL